MPKPLGSPEVEHWHHGAGTLILDKSVRPPAPVANATLVFREYLGDGQRGDLVDVRAFDAPHSVFTPTSNANGQPEEFYAPGEIVWASADNEITWFLSTTVEQADLRQLVQASATDAADSAATVQTLSGDVSAMLATVNTVAGQASAAAGVAENLEDRVVALENGAAAGAIAAGTVLGVNKAQNGGTWPDRPTSRTDVTVMWVGAEPSPPSVTSGTGGMYDHDLRFVTP